MTRVLPWLIGGILILVFSCTAVFGQGAVGQISGTVTDASRAVLPGVEINATQTDTGLIRKTISSESGYYVFPNLPVGPYRLEISLAGFRTFTQTGIVLQVNSSVTINAVLEIGQLAENVEVTANASMVEARSTGVGQVINNSQVLELPLIGRQAQDLITLAGAAIQTTVTTSTSRSLPGIESFSVAGGVSTGTAFTLDGVSHNDIRSAISLPLPFPDALQEFKVETSAVPAQYGFRSGGAVNAVTRSGGNDFHGTGFEFVRNEKFNARNFFSTGPDPLKRNQFGGTFGGPIRKNKLFFFGGYQGTTTRTNPTSNRSFVPTPAMLQGDFTAYASAACQGTNRTLTGPFVNNRIDPALLSPAAVNMARKLPPPVDQCGLVLWSLPASETDHQMVERLDYNLRNTHTIFGRYMEAWYSAPIPYTLSGGNALTSPFAGFSDTFHALAVGDTITLGTNMVNSFRANWTHVNQNRTNSAFFGPEDIGVKVYPGIPHRTSLEITGGFNLGGATSHPVNFREGSGQISDDFSVLTGNHQLGFGATLIGFQINNDAVAYPSGDFQFTGQRTGLGLADLLAGLANSALQDAPNYQYIRQKYVASYIQDSWKIRPELSLNVGIRWEPYLPPTYLRAAMFVWDEAAFLNGQKTTQYMNAPPGFFYQGDRQWPTSNSNPVRREWGKFVPRIGLVWDPKHDGKMAIRAAYGIFNDTVKAEQYFTSGKSSPLGTRLSLSNFNFDDPYRNFPGGNPFPYVPGPNAPYPVGGTFNAIPADNTPPYVQQWNVGVQREVAANWLLSATYIGNRVIHLFGADELNPAVFIPGVANDAGQCVASIDGRAVSLKVNPGATCSTTANTTARRKLALLNPVEGPKMSYLDAPDWGGTRTYNGMLLSVQRRMNSHVSFTANYTWSHCIGNISIDFLNTTPGGTYTYKIPGNRAYDRGNCIAENLGADIRHIVNGTALFEMPQFTSHPWLQRFAGNWRLSNILRVRSGDHFNIVSGTDQALTGEDAAMQRADQISTAVYGNQCRTDLRKSNGSCFWINRSAFAPAGVGQFGNSQIGALQGPGFWTIDAGLSRIFSVTERQQVEFRAEASNVLNHTNFMDPNGSLINGQFGRLQSANDPRIMQFALKYVF